MAKAKEKETKSSMEPNHIKKFLVFLLVLCLAAADESGTHALSTCNGSIAECEREGELLMVSGISHRVLEEQSHISYGALKRDKPACTSAGRGEPYRSCYPDPSNPYSRGCSRIYRCRDDS